MTRRRLILALAPALALFCAVVLARFDALELSARESEARIRAAQAEHEALRHEATLGAEIYRLKTEISLLKLERDLLASEAAGCARCRSAGGARQADSVVEEIREAIALASGEAMAELLISTSGIEVLP